MDASLKPFIDYQVDPGPLKALSFSVMHGANYFSAGPVVVLRLDLGEYDEVFTDAIPGFAQRLKEALPSLAAHHCSVGEPEGFFTRVREGTLLGHVTEHVAIELQTLAGMDVSYGKTRSTTAPGVYNVVFRFFDELAGLYAGRAAVNLVNSLLLGLPFEAEAAVAGLVRIREERMLGPSTAAVVEEAERRGIPWLRLDEYNLVQLGTGRFQKRIRATITSDTGYLGVEAADDKLLAMSLLGDAGIPVPETAAAASAEEALEFHRRTARPLAIKPATGSLGRGVTLGAGDEAAVRRGFEWAAMSGGKVIVQPFLPGRTYRLLVIGHKMVAAVRQSPPEIAGDGSSTVAQLVEELNRSPGREVGDKARLTKVEIDEITLRIMAEKGHGEKTVLPRGQVLALKNSGSLKLGGEAVDVTDEVHPDNRFLAERASRVIGLDVAGIDLVAEDIGRPAMETGGAVIEVNAAPDFRMHLRPTQGDPRPVAGPFLDLLFPDGAGSRIPVISVTGTLGKTLAVNLISHCLNLARVRSGMTSTEGLYISGRRLMETDCTYPEHVALVLKDPTIDCAVLETSREGILRRGLGYRLADVGVVLNMHDDHVGSDDIRYIEDLAYAKAVVAEQIYPQGCAVLNADNALVMNMAERVSSRLMLFSRDAGSPRVRSHILKGGAAVVLEGDDAMLYRDGSGSRLFDITEIPLSYGGRAKLAYDAILGAAGALAAHGMALERIRYGLKSFFPDPKVLPGRLNLVEVGDFKVLVDYAHNRQGFLGLKDFLGNYAEEKAGVLDAAGDRSDAEISALGALAAGMFGRLVLYEGHDRRGRPPGNIVELLRQGARSAGMAEGKIQSFLEPEEAWRAGLGLGGPGAMVVILSARGQKVLEMIGELSGKKQ
jgi:cyanophycin synthetase